MLVHESAMAPWRVRRGLAGPESRRARPGRGCRGSAVSAWPSPMVWVLGRTMEMLLRLWLHGAHHLLCPAVLLVYSQECD